MIIMVLKTEEENLLDEKTYEMADLLRRNEDLEKALATQDNAIQDVISRYQTMELDFKFSLSDIELKN